MDTATEGTIVRVEKFLAKECQAHLADVYKDVTSRLGKLPERATRDVLSEADLDAVFGPLTVQNKRLRDRMRDAIAKSIRTFADKLGAALGVATPAELPAWKLLLEARVNRLVEGVTDNGQVIYKGWNQELRDTVRNAVSEGYSKGESTGKIAARIAEGLDVDPSNPRAVRNRALTIARTETNGLANTTGWELANESPLVKKKAWYSISDNRSRQSHIDAAAKYNLANAIPIGEQFNVGGVSMDHPHDPSAPAGEVVNCRCRVLYTA